MKEAERLGRLAFEAGQNAIPRLVPLSAMS